MINIYFFLSSIFVLPTIIGLLVIISISIIVVVSYRRNIYLNRNYLIYISFFAIFSIIAFFPSILLGSQEAVKFMGRSLSSALTFVCANIIFKNYTRMKFEKFLFGSLFFISLNSFFVIITALNPDIYEFLRINQFNGSLVLPKHFRSPGFLQGYDVAGFTAVVGLVVLRTLLNVKKLSLRIVIIIYIVLFLSTLFSSRSSLILFAAFSVLFAINSESFSNMDEVKFKILKIIMLLFGVLSVYAFLILVFGFWDVAIAEKLSFGFVSAKEISRFYNINNFSDYLSHFNVELASLFYNDKANFLPDNSFMRIAVSGGWWALSFVLVSFIVILVPCISRKSSSDRGFIVLISVVIFISSIKTNYLYYIPFFFIFSVAWVVANTTNTKYV